jgi:hypothetical protein
MEPLFRIERAQDFDGGLLGYDWIEVLAIEPWALAFRTNDYGEWCDRKILNHYICLTPQGLVRITSEDFWVALEELNEYDPETDNSPPPRYIVTTGDSSVVQLQGTIHGGISTVHTRYSADTVGAQGAGSQGIAAPPWLPEGSSLEDLRAELQTLRTALRKQSTTAEEDMTVAAVAEAEFAAAGGDESGVVAALRRAGRWALDAAKEIGLEVAKAAAQQAIGQ